MRKLDSNNYNVTAYYLDGGNGIDRVYIYQNDKFLCECKRIETFNVSRAERTAEDEQRMAEQMKYISQYNKMINGISSQLYDVEILEKSSAEPVEVEVVETIEANDNDDNFFEELSYDYSPEAIRAKAFGDI